jgi:hypothetical protein
MGVFPIFQIRKLRVRRLAQVPEGHTTVRNPIGAEDPRSPLGVNVTKRA